VVVGEGSEPFREPLAGSEKGSVLGLIGWHTFTPKGEAGAVLAFLRGFSATDTGKFSPRQQPQGCSVVTSSHCAKGWGVRFSVGSSGLR